MPRKKWDPTSQEFIDDMIQHVRTMSREELLESLAWYPEGVEQTWRLAKDPEIMFPEFATDSAGRVVGANPGVRPPRKDPARKAG